MYQEAPNDQELAQLLATSHSIAIIGVSDKPDRASYGVAKWLIENSHLEVYLVNPRVEDLLGKKVYPSLDSLPSAVDIVDVFRNIADVPPILEEAIAANAKVFWLQLDLISQEVAEKAEAAGLTSVQNRCTKIEYARLLK